MVALALSFKPRYEFAMPNREWMIYGANGYTGKLCAESAKQRGESPVLAGRSEEKVRPLAERLKFPWRCFDLPNKTAAVEGLKGMALVLNCAGPFSQTSHAMVEACLEAGVHYLDVTGEIPVFEKLAALSEQASRRGVLLLPGVGFDIVPSDCMAAHLAEKMPTATDLEIAFATAGNISPGTMKTMVEGIGQGGCFRRNGKITFSPIGEIQKRVRFSHGERLVVSIPWGDVSTAYHSTKIPNITCYSQASASQARLMKVLPVLGPVLRSRTFQKTLQRVIEKTVRGPSEEKRKQSSMYVWGRVTDASGHSKEAWLDGPEGYDWTVLLALASVRAVLKEAGVKGFKTPSQLFGWKFVETAGGAFKEP